MYVMAAELQESARVKINLNLHVTGKRPDGFHELESLVVFAPPGDILIAREAEQAVLDLAGPFAAALSSTDDNLVLRAANALAAHAGATPSAYLRLEKNLPIASGLGGGSADAAAALRTLKALWQLGVSDSELHEIAFSLGADVPACLISRPLIMRGIGEQLELLDAFPRFDMLLVNPGVGVSTPQVFQKLAWTSHAARQAMPSLPEAATKDAVITWLKRTKNDLQEPAIRLVPEIAATLDALQSTPGCKLARMSGSGATCFGIYENPHAVVNGSRQIRSKHAHWWISSVKTDGASS